jgi:phosphonopyruvate decarboxylase
MKNVFGVPCSKLKGKIEMDNLDVYCTSEEEALAMAAGAWFAKAKPIVYMQNTGLCRVINLCLTLFKPYNIPLPKIVLSLRKTPPHHYPVFCATKELLELSGFSDIEMVEES